MSLLESLMEALNKKQEAYVDKLKGNYSPETAHIEVFDQYPKKHPDRIVLPIERLKIDVDKTVRQHLAKNGWGVHNYTAGLAGRYITDKNGNQKLQLKSIGKILNETGADNIKHPEMLDRLKKDSTGKPLTGEDGRFISEKVPQSILHFYNNDKNRASTNNEMNMAISRDVNDIGGMSSGRAWESSSCMRLPHTSSDVAKCKETMLQHKLIKGDFKHHTLAVYAIKKGDDDIENPVARILLKKFISSKGHAIYRTDSSDVYGNEPKGFEESVNKFAEHHWPAEPKTQYMLANGLYKEEYRPNIAQTPNNIGYVEQFNGHSHFNKQGKLHDFIDENGVQKPAKYEKTADAEITKHFKDGKLHNENGPASTIINKQGTMTHYAIDGKYHNPAGPAVKLESKNGDIHEEYHIDGMFHREGNLPALNIKNKNKTLQIYSRYGLEHRDGDKPSYIEKNDTGLNEINVKYHKFGELHRDGDKPAVFHAMTANGKILMKTKSYYKHGLLNRDNDLPTEITTDGMGRITKKWHKDGKLHRENGKPAILSYDRETKKPYQTEYYLNGERQA